MEGDYHHPEEDSTVGTEEDLYCGYKLNCSDSPVDTNTLSQAPWWLFLF